MMLQTCHSFMYSIQSHRVLFRSQRNPPLSRSGISTYRKQHKLPAAYYRGGTSRAVIFREEDLPKDRKEWPSIFRGVIGSPDSNGRQLDGMGGGLSSLSKVCVVGKSIYEKGADVDYTFAAIGVTNDEVDFSRNCGNMTSAIGPFAVDKGLVEVPENGDVTVRIHNTNTNKLIDAKFPVIDGEAASDGDFAIDGVAGTAARIELGFLDPAGSRTGKLLPTGNPIDNLDGIDASLVDCGNPCCFVRAEDLSVDGTILPDALDSNITLLKRPDRIRRQASVAMGLSSNEASAPTSVPKIAMLTKPMPHTLSSGETLNGEEVDLVVRALSVGQPHRAVPLTVAMAVAAAAKLKGSTVHSLCTKAETIDPNGLTLGHPTGKIIVGANFTDNGEVTDATVFRTARRLMEGRVYWK